MGCLDSEEEDGLGSALDFFRLCDPKVMLQFLFACNKLLSNDSDDYSKDEEGYDPTQECFNVGREEHVEGDQLGMPRENNVPPPHAREPMEMGEAQPPKSRGPPRAALRVARQARRGTKTNATASAGSRPGSSQQGS